MPRFDSLMGGYNTAISPNITSELTINWIPERNAVPVQNQGDVQDKNVRAALIRTPGLHTFATLPLTPVRGVFPGDRSLFAASGDHFYQVFHDGTFTDRSIPGFPGSSGSGPAGGSIGNDGNPVQAFFNGNQVLLISAGNAYLDNGNGPAPVQFSAQLTDLLVDPANANQLTTPTGGIFDATDVGRTILITGGAGFNVGLSQPVTGIFGSGEAVGASAWGIAGSGLGTGIEFLGTKSFTDLTLVSPFIVSSAASPFGPGDVGTTLTITSGTGFTPGSYTITGLVLSPTGTPTGNAILSAPAGTAGASPGVGSLDDMPVTASQGAFLDGYYFLVPGPPTKTVYYSAINDGMSWDPLDFFVKANYPDNVAALFTDHEELYTWGGLESSEVWRDVGNADNPFAPDPGATMHLGCQAPFSPVRLGNGVAWIGGDVRRGERRAFAATGYAPIPVSTPAVEAAWGSYSTIADAVSFNLMYQGHELWVITFPAANATWMFDAATGFWSQWGYWNGSSWDRARVWVHCVVAFPGQGEQHYGGDWQTGQIYAVSNQYKTDDGHAIVRRRRAPHLTVENQRRFYARFEIDCDVLGLQRIFWNRLGAGRDRIWQLDTQQSSEAGGVTITLSFSDDRTQSFQSMFTQALSPSVDVRLSNAYLKWVDATWN